MTEIDKRNGLQRAFTVLLIFFICIGCYKSPPSLQEAQSYSTPALLENIRSSGVLRVGTTGDYMPYSYRHKGSMDSLQGIDIALAKDLANSLGVEVEYVPTSWPTLMADLKANKYDIGMSGITITLERQKQALFSLPFSSGGKAAITRDENVEKFQSISAINQESVRVIVNPGGTNEQFTRSNFPNATIILNEDNLSIFQRIVKGEADVMVTDAIETRVQELIHPELEAVNPDTPFNFFEKAYLLPVDHTFKA
ncbi:MAG: transporter substrate-binding domain-containing protein, partial [Bacteroidota bacterium]